MAPLSNAERQKRYRERLKQNNPEKYEQKRKAHLEKVKQNKKKQSQLNENEKERQRERWRKYSANYYKKQKNKNSENEPIEDTKLKKIHKKYRRKIRKLKNEVTESMEIAKIHIKENRRLRKQILQLQKRAVTTSNLLNTYLVDKQCCLLKESCDCKSQTDLKLTSSTTDALTPKKKTELFIDSLQSVNEEDKNKLKEKILELNVLSESLKQNYRTATKNEKRMLKKIVMNRFTSKYKIKTRLSKICTGLVGKIRKSGNIINRRRKKRIEEIHNFYNRDDVSRATAGKKETKTKNKEKIQRRYLLDTVKNLHKKYKEEGGKASYSSFLRHRPFYVLTPKLNDCDTCACIKHENFQFIIDKLFTAGIIKTNNIGDIMKELSCDLNSKACMYNECVVCSSKTLSMEDNYNKAAKITWKQWRLKKVLYQKNDEEGNLKDHETKKYRREEIETTLEELLNKFKEEGTSFKKHFFNNSHQQKVFRESRENITPDEAIIICDFSENYQCRHHTEIQGVHFNASRNQITLHTGVLYIYNEKPISFCTLSPNTEHSPYSIWAHLTPILKYIKTKCPRINKLHFFSDGPSTQYKQKLNFILFSKITKDYGFKNCTWNYFESAHGKNAADGIGGAVKRTLDSCVAFGLDIPDAETAIQVLREKSKITLYYVNDANIKAIKEYLGDEKVIPLKGTMAVHQIITTENENHVKYRDISCLCGENRGQCMCFNIKIHCLTHSASASGLEAEATSKTKKRLTKKEGKVIVLSDVKLKEENLNFYKTLPLCLRAIDPNTEVFSERKNMTEERIEPQRQKERKKREGKRTPKGNKRPIKKRKPSNSSTTSESADISIYSDSDVENFEEMENDLPGEKVLKRKTSNSNSINVNINYHGYISGNEERLEPERQKERKKRVEKRTPIGNKRPIKKRKLSNASTVSEGVDINIYSDSDVENFEDIADSNDINKPNAIKDTSSVHIKKKAQQIQNEENIENTIIQDELPETNLTKNSQFTKDSDVENFEDIADSNDTNNPNAIKDTSSVHIKRKAQQIQNEENIQNAIIQDEIQETNLTKKVSMEKIHENSDLQDDIRMKNEGNNLIGEKVLRRKSLNNLVEKGNTQSQNKSEEIKKTILIETNEQEKSLEESNFEKEDSRKKAKDLIDDDNTQEQNKNEEWNDPQNEIFEVGDTVLVRYSNRKTWKYYVGVIVDITDVNDKFYTISFYKTVNTKGNVKFRKQLRLDIDKVPEILIVKKIELLQISENPYELVLFHDEDSVYFI